MAVRIQNLAAEQAEGLSLAPLNRELQVSRNVLTEVQNPGPISAAENLGNKVFFLPNIHIIGSYQRCFRCFHNLGFAIVGRNHQSIVHFSVFQVSKADGAIVAPFPTIIGTNGFLASIGIDHFQLCDHTGLPAINTGNAKCR